jgi:hypothetical protein
MTFAAFSDLTASKCVDCGRDMIGPRNKKRCELCVGAHRARQDRQRREDFGWVLSDVIALPEPTPCRGMQGVWWADQVTAAAVYAQLPQEVSRERLYH